MNENTNPVDIESLKKCEEIIQRGLHTFWEVGNALLEVRDKQLWAIEYDTFNAYLAVFNFYNVCAEVNLGVLI